MYLHISVCYWGSSHCLAANTPSFTLKRFVAFMIFSLCHILCTFMLLVILSLVIVILHFSCYLFCFRKDHFNSYYCQLVSNLAPPYQKSIKTMSLNNQDGCTLAKEPLSLDYNRRRLDAS